MEYFYFEDMDNLFYECFSLISFPDISKWDKSKVKNSFILMSISH